MRKLISTDIGAKYFTPAIKPRFKPHLRPSITPFGISKPRVAPRILPTPIKSVTSVAKPPRVPVSGVSQLLKQAPAGSKPVTSPKPPKRATAPKSQSSQPPSGRVTRAQGTRPVSSGVMRPPASMANKQPGLHPTRQIKTAKRNIRRQNPFKVKIPKPVKL